MSPAPRRAAVGGLVGLVMVLVAVPAGLLWWIGNPLPTAGPGGWRAWLDHPVSAELLIHLLACAIWLLWGLLAYTVIASVVSVVARISIPLPRTAVPLRAAIATALGATVIAATTGAALPVSPAAASPTPGTDLDSANPAATARTGTASTAPGERTPTFAAAGYDGQLTVQAGGRHYTVTVRRHDTLWDIARTWLGDPYRWPEIYQLNRARYDQHGRMHHGDLILPGWILRLPDDATPPPGAQPAPLPPAPPTPTPGTASHPPPATPTPPGTTPSTAAPTGVPRPAHSATPGTPTSTRQGIDLPGIGWITLDTATAIAAAVALLWLQRRRRYHPQPTGRRPVDADLARLPASIAAIHHTRTFAEESMDAPPDHGPPTATTVTAASLGTHPDHTDLRVPDLPADGVGIVGDGTEAALRGILVAVLAAGGPWTPDTDASIITTRADLDRLLPDEAPDLDRLHVADTISNALTMLERELLRHARLADDHPDDQQLLLPPVVLLTTAPTVGQATRLQAILSIGARLGISAILDGPWDVGSRWHVHLDGTTTDQRDQPGPRLATLTATAATDILNLLHQARTDTGPATPTTAAPPDGQPAADPTTFNWPPRPASPAPAEPPPRTPGADALPTRLAVTVLGRPHLATAAGDSDPEPLRIRRTDGLQILIYLAVHPHGATSDEILADVWPEVRPHHARHRLHTTLSELRLQLEQTTGADIVVRTGDRYHLDPHSIDIDLWRLSQAIDTAATTLDTTTHRQALHHVVDLYTGELADGHSWLWIIPYREQTRRHIIDAYTDLATASTDPRQALEYVEHAIRIDPYIEDNYQRAMRLHATLGDAEGVTRTLRTLTRRLAELDIPAPANSQQLATDLVRRIQARHRATT